MDRPPIPQPQTSRPGTLAGQGFQQRGLTYDPQRGLVSTQDPTRIPSPPRVASPGASSPGRPASPRTADGYKDIPTVPADDWQITATPQNKAFLQATLRTARETYPPFSMYVDYVVDNAGSGRYRRSQFPSYLKDATPFEIFRLYKDNYGARGLIQSVQDDDDFVRYMERAGFISLYDILFVKAEIVSDLDNSNLTPESLEFTLTDDQRILMEAWRKKALTPFTVEGMTNKIVLDLGQYNELHQPSLVVPYSPFPKYELEGVIRQVNERLGQSSYGPYSNEGGITRRYLMYEGESAVRPAGTRTTYQYDYISGVQKPVKINLKEKDFIDNTVPQSGSLPKAYFQMLYMELAKRGIIDADGKVTVPS